MYFCTYGGLSVYDGARFKNYTTSNGLLHDLVNDVLEVGEDSLLIAVNTGGLNVLVNGVMKKLETQDKACPVINQFLKTDDGIYLSADDGLHILQDKKITKLPAFVPYSRKPVVYLGDLAAYSDFIIFTTNDLRENTGLFLYSRQLNRITDVLPGLTVTCLGKDKTSQIWVGSASGMYNLDTVALRAGKLKLGPSYLQGKTEFLTYDIAFNSFNDAVGISDEPYGIIRYSRNGIRETIPSPVLSSNAIESFLIDREDVLWICNNGNGVYKLSNTRLRSTGIFSDNRKSIIRTAKQVSPYLVCMVMSDGKWVVANGKQIRTFNVQNAFQKTVYPLHINKGYLYATSANHLYRAPWPNSDGNSLRFKKVFSIPAISSFGGLGVTDPHGNLICFDRTNIYVLQDSKVVFRFSTPVFDQIQGLHVDKNGFLWVVSRMNGLVIYSFHPEDPTGYLKKKIEFIREFETASPRAIVIDKNETLWVGTRDHGLMGLEYKNNRLTKRYHYKTSDGLTDNFVTSLACDAANNIIVGTQTGIDRLITTNEGNHHLENITKSNNIFAFIFYVWTDFQNNAFALTNTGNVFEIQTPHLHAPAAEPQLFFEELKVNGRRVAITSSRIELKHDQRNISLSVAAPTFLNEKQVKYSYLLTGSGDDRWSDTSAVADIHLLNLAPGNYTLNVKAFFPSTKYTPKEKHFLIVIHPPWWQTGWFRLAILASLVAMIILSVRFYYRRKLEKQTLFLEKQRAVDNERTRIATDMHDDLGAGLSRIKFLSETIGIKRQQNKAIEEDINKIKEYSHQMIDTMGEMVWALNEKNDSLSDLLSYTRAYAMEYLSLNGIVCHVDLPENVEKDFIRGEFRRNVFLSVKEILHNIVKHANANHVSITIEAGKNLVIQIIDDGKGFDPLNIRPFSNGLSNIEKRMRDIGGKSEINNRKGTLVKLTAPLPSLPLHTFHENHRMP